MSLGVAAGSHSDRSLSVCGGGHPSGMIGTSMKTAEGDYCKQSCSVSSFTHRLIAAQEETTVK